MQQGNVYINIGATGTNYTGSEIYGASGTYGLSDTNYGMSGASGTNELYINNIQNVGPSGTFMNSNVPVGASGTIMNSNNNQMFTGNYHSQQYSYNYINIYSKVGINDDDFNFQAGMLQDTKRHYHLAYKNFKFDVVVDINQLEDENLICNGEFKKMLQYINSIIDIVDDDRIKKYCNIIINKDYFINKNLKRSIHITI